MSSELAAGYHPLGQHLRRTTRPVTIAGVDLPRGADVLLVLASANRDTERYTDAARFDVTRTPTRHFGFGAGVHTCVGAGPARLMARVALSAPVERLPGLAPGTDRPIPLRRSINVRGPLSLEVRW